MAHIGNEKRFKQGKAIAMIGLFSLQLVCSLAAGSLRSANAAPDLGTALAGLEQQWAKISYQLPTANQESAFAALLQQAETLSRQFPDEALPLAWHGIILCSYAESRGGLQALGNVTQARDLFLQAKAIDPQVMNGTVDGYLGTLYSKVPGWPVAFGDDQQAQRYFRQEVAANPHGIDTDYLYGHYLLSQGDKQRARQYLNAGLTVPIRSDHADYDTGRRRDIAQDLAKIK